MLKDIAVGRYYNSSSPIHRTDPRTKIICTVIYSAAVLVASSPISAAAAAVTAAIAVAAAKLPPRRIILGLKPMRWFLLFALVINAFAVPGDILWQYGIVHVTRQGIYAGAVLSVRLVLFVIGASVLTLTTTPTELTDGLARLMKPLRYLRVPTEEIAMIISITLRFIPLFADEAEKIMKAQRARGADFSGRGPVKRAKALIPIAVPLFVSVFRHAEELSEAMDARCYGRGVRRPRKKTHFGYIDAAICGIMIIFCVFSGIIEFLH